MYKNVIIRNTVLKRGTSDIFLFNVCYKVGILIRTSEDISTSSNDANLSLGIYSQVSLRLK